MKELIEALLKDENGISEDAYHALLDYLATWFDPSVARAEEQRKEAQALYDYARSCDATDGRFYLPEDG